MEVWQIALVVYLLIGALAISIESLRHRDDMFHDPQIKLFLKIIAFIIFALIVPPFLIIFPIMDRVQQQKAIEPS